MKKAKKVLKEWVVKKKTYSMPQIVKCGVYINVLEWEIQKNSQAKKTRSSQEVPCEKGQNPQESIIEEENVIKEIIIMNWPAKHAFISRDKKLAKKLKAHLKKALKRLFLHIMN